MTWMGFVDRWLNARRGKGVISHTCRVRLDEEGVHIDNPVASSLVGWSALTQVLDGPDSIVFRRNSVLAAYVPTAAFAAAGERDAFLAFARARVPSA